VKYANYSRPVSFVSSAILLCHFILRSFVTFKSQEISRAYLSMLSRMEQFKCVSCGCHNDNHYFPIRSSPIDVSNGSTLCALWRMKWVLMYNTK